MKRTKPPKHRPGRKTLFKPEMYRQVEELAKLGATNEQIADFFDISVKTLEYWMRMDEEFKRRRKRGGMVADMKVVESLYRRATGYTYKETEGKVYKGQLITYTVEKEAVPDVTACIFWLKNRQRAQWADVQNVNHSHSGEIHHRKLEDIPLEEFTPEEQDFLFEMSLKQIGDGKRNN